MFDPEQETPAVAHIEEATPEVTPVVEATPEATVPEATEAPEATA